MAVACTSRFACLKLEDDEFCDSVNKSIPTQNGNQAGKGKTNAKPGSNDLKSKAKKKKKNDNAEVCV